MSANLFITSTIDWIDRIRWDESKANRLKALRGDDSVQSLADRTGISQQLINRLEKNQVSPTSLTGKPPTVAWETLKAICKGLSVSVEEFLWIQVVTVSKDFSKTP
jgi:DNA-binding Xre family transcriptional regulator